MIGDMDVVTITTTGNATSNFYIATPPMWYGSSALTYNANNFYITTSDSTGVLNVGSSGLIWGGEPDPPPLDQQEETKKQEGFVEIEPRWWVHKDTGQINHVCSGHFRDILVLNSTWHKFNVICSTCHAPTPNKAFFLSQALK